jgi:hypothetical protein
MKLRGMGRLFGWLLPNPHKPLLPNVDAGANQRPCAARLRKASCLRLAARLSGDPAVLVV